jgi:AbiU2
MAKKAAGKSSTKRRTAKKSAAKKRVAKLGKNTLKKLERPLELLRIVRAISIGLDEAVAYFETYVPSGQNRTLLDRINRTGFHPAFNVVSDALHRNVIMALCRIWDTRDDTADINTVARAFRDPDMLAKLRADGHAMDAKELKAWLKAVGAVNNSMEFRALKRARHRALAHTATPNVPYDGSARVAQYGDERVVLEKTITLVEKAGEFINYTYIAPFAEQRRIRKEHAAAFWAEVAKDA